jgi:hypothetical protein
MPLPQSFEMHTASTKAHCSGAWHTMPLEHTADAGLFAHDNSVMQSASPHE